MREGKVRERKSLEGTGTKRKGRNRMAEGREGQPGAVTGYIIEDVGEKGMEKTGGNGGEEKG